MGRVFAVDSESGWAGGVEVPSAFTPVVFCAIDIVTGERHAFFGRDAVLRRWIQDHDGDLFLAHNLMAEAKYLLQLGVEPPTRWFDTMFAYRYVTNKEKNGKYGLEYALADLGLPYGFSADEKGDLQEKIGNLKFHSSDPVELRRIRDYCFEDALGSGRIYRKLTHLVPTQWMNYVTAFALELAQSELRGVGIDMTAYGQLLERREEVVEVVTRRVNAIEPVFDGDHFNKGQFFSWCVRHGIGWPMSRSPRTGKWFLSLEDEIFDKMKGRHPFIDLAHEARKTITQLNRRALAVDGRTGRHYFGNIPLAQATGRTSLKNCLLLGPKWMRHLVVPPSSDHVIVIVDFDAEEICIAAYLSNDRNMLTGYTAGDPHMAFAILAGAAPVGAVKKTHSAVRSLYKSANLAVNYGQGPYGLSQKTGMTLSSAKRLLAQHKRVYAEFWQWVEAYKLDAFRQGVCRTALGWPRKVSRQDNPRSVGNFAVQGGGSDLMRLAVYYLSRAGLRLLATIHDGFILECHRDEVPAATEAINAALRQAVNQVFPGAPMTWTNPPEVYKERYEDDDGKPLWNLVKGVLRPSGKAFCSVGGW